MKNLVVSCFLFFCTLQTFSQQEYFIYLQTDNNQAFYVRINNSVYSSSSTGYLILSKLADSATSVTIGFPKSVFPEQQFNIPANHKDGGYVLKNADKGWGLFNLQTPDVITSSSPKEEKKKPEITGSRRSDAFSSLLANAVNDSAVLYTVNKPPKPVIATPVVIAAEEKKKDTIAVAKKDLLRKDSIVFVKKQPGKKDNSITAKNINQIKKDSATAVKRLPRAKEPVVIVKNRKPARDTGAVVKSNPPPPAADLVKRNTAVLKDTNAKNINPQKRDTIIISSSTRLPGTKEKSGIAKNKKERRDTIIMMNGNKPENNQPIAKNTMAKREKLAGTEQRKDSLQLIKKEIMQAPEEKRNALLNNKDAVVVETIPVQNDTPANKPVSKKDTAEAFVKNEPVKPAETKPDTIASVPAKRLRPLVYKAAELLTDTSYVAVFVDESKDKFDTIRISIPFNEQMMQPGMEKPVVKPIGTNAEKIKKDSTPATVINQIAAVPVKKDTVADKVTKEDAGIIPQQNIPVPIKTDTIIADKKKDSSITGITQRTVSPAIKPDTTAVNKPGSTAAGKPVKDSVPVTANREAAPYVIKKDSTPVVIDSARTTKALPDSTRTPKAPAQPLFLNSDCKEVAADSDIDKLRIKMLLVVSDEDRISLAKKLFKQKCFLVQQVKALSELFKTDEGKYKWFDAAYAYVSDTGNFSSLGDLIKDDYYLIRFKAMLRH